MAEQQEKTSSSAPASGQKLSEKDIPLDTQLLSDAVIELNISRKNVGIYPPGHVQIVKSIDRAYDVLLKLFAIREEMTLGVAKDTLFVGQNYLDQKNPVYRNFALALNAQGIAAVTFVRGLDLGELERFHRIITTKPEDIIAAGGIAKVVASMDIPHIKVIPIDYSSFHLTEEQEIFKTQTKSSEKSAENAEKTAGGMWMDFVSLISSGMLAKQGEGVSIKDATKIDPSELAKLLNERKLNAGAAVQSYDHIISSHIRKKAEKKLTKEQSETLKNLNDMLRELHPDLRKQFLSSAFKNLAENPQSPGAEEILGGMGDDMIIDMLRHASAEGREISPSLTGLLSKLASVRDRSKDAPKPENKPVAAGHAVQEAPPDILPEQLENLFQREKYEEYVETEYDQLLKRASERAEAMAASSAERFPVADYLKTLKDEHLDFQIGRALIAFMEEKIDAEDYKEFARKLSTLVPDLLASGNFVLLLDILTTLRWHMSDKQDPTIRAAVSDVLSVFWQQDFIAAAVNAFDAWSRTKGKAAGELLLALGPPVIPGLMDIFAADTSPGGRRIVFDLLSSFGASAVAEALKRLEDPRPHFVRNLLMLIRRVGTPDVAPSVKPLLQHQDAKVRLEALAVLLRFNEPSAAELLRKEILSNDPDVSSQAVFLAGQYRVANVVGAILSLIKSVVFFESDYRVNEEIIRALGEIGDPRAIPELEKLAKSGFSLYPESHSRMKLAIYQYLERYPRDSITGLIKIGEKSNDEKIRAICRKLSKEK